MKMVKLTYECKNGSRIFIYMKNGKVVVNYNLQSQQTFDNLEGAAQRLAELHHKEDQSCPLQGEVTPVRLLAQVYKTQLGGLYW